jgi:hypothetical protein
VAPQSDSLPELAELWRVELVIKLRLTCQDDLQEFVL